MALELKTGQKQLLSQKMIQSSTILQMAASDLEDYLNEQTLENPVLDLVQKQPEQYEEKNLEKYQWIYSHDEQNRYLYQKIESHDDDMVEWNFDTQQDESLQDYLWEQLLVKSLPSEYEDDLKTMLENLDEKGYFTESLEDFCARYDMDSRRASLLLTLIKTLEPAGVGAQSLNECLCLQLERQDMLTPMLSEFIYNHLEQVAKNQLPAIAKEMKVSLNEIKQYCSLIRKLNPRPTAFLRNNQQTLYINPDVIVVKFEDHLDILLNESLYPDISLNTEYVRMCRSSDNKEVQSYLLKKISQAEWIKQCIAQRNTTLFSVAQTIVSFQKAFFHKGDSYLKPLRLIDVAESLGIHESTVSRAVHQKYLQCSWGTFPLSYFFVKSASHNSTASIFKSSSDTENTSTTLDVKAALKKIVANENKKKPYSDRILSELLEEQGFPISRRTVAKYREEENIPSASARKEY